MDAAAAAKAAWLASLDNEPTWTSGVAAAAPAHVPAAAPAVAPVAASPAMTDVAAAKAVLDSLDGRLDADHITKLRLFAHQTLTRFDTETWKGNEYDRYAPRAAPRRTPRSDKIFRDKGWNCVESGFKLF